MPPKRAKKSDEAVFEGMVVAVSGTFSVSQSEIKKLLESNGATIANSVTRKVTHLITTPHELSIETAKVVAARKNSLPILSEEFVHSSIKASARADESKFLLDGMPSSSAAKAADEEAPEADDDRKRKRRTAKPADDEDEEEDDEEEEAEAKPKRGAAKKAAPAKKAGAKRAAASAAKAAEAPAPAPAPPVKEEVKKEEPKPSMTKTSSVAVQGPFIGRRPNSKSEVVFSFDTTGSMYPCLTQVRKKIQEATQRLFKEVPGIRIGIVAHGDYCDRNTSYVTKHLDLTNDMSKIVNFVETVGQTGGGDCPECYELVLREAQTHFSWSPDANHSLVLIGDDLPHEANANPDKIDWRQELVALKAKDICVYAVQALNRSYATNFYFTCAKDTGGIHISLDQFNAITDLLIAVCYRESTPEQLEVFEKEVIAQGRYSRSVRQMFDKLTGRETTTATSDKNLQAVSSGRFQVLDIDSDTSIKDFVQANGLSFKTGRGFYEFTKPETVQKYKEIILMDKNGDMFEGEYARELLGLPKGADAKVKPSEYDFVVFVQSTSYNRKLVGGTRFLYEVEDWDRTM